MILKKKVIFMATGKIPQEKKAGWLCLQQTELGLPKPLGSSVTSLGQWKVIDKMHACERNACMGALSAWGSEKTCTQDVCEQRNACMRVWKYVYLNVCERARLNYVLQGLRSALMCLEKSARWVRKPLHIWATPSGQSYRIPFLSFCSVNSDIF